MLKELESAAVPSRAARASGYTRVWLDRLTGSPDRKDVFSAAVPTKRGAAPEKSVKAIAFVASDKTSYITGQIIRVSGGETAS